MRLRIQVIHHRNKICIKKGKKYALIMFVASIVSIELQSVLLSLHCFSQVQYLSSIISSCLFLSFMNDSLAERDSPLVSSAILFSKNGVSSLPLMF